MPEKKQHVVIYRGETVEIGIDLFDANGDPLTGLDPSEWTYAVGTLGSAPLLTLTDTDLAVAANRITVTLTATQTQAFPAALYTHELYRDNGGVVTTFVIESNLQVKDSHMAFHSA